MDQLNFAVINQHESKPAAPKQEAEQQSLGHLPTWGLDDDLRDTVEIMGRHRTQQDFAVCGLFAATSVCLGNNIIIDSGDYQNRTNLWFLQIADSASGKSFPMKWFKKPLQKLQEEDTGTEKKKRYLLRDATYEAMCEVLRDNNHVGLFPGEAIPVFRGIDKYNGGDCGTIQRFCDIIDGSEISYDRKGSPSFDVPNPFLSFLGDVQPDLLKSILNNNIIAMGLAARILMVYPESVALKRSQEPIPENLETIWDRKAHDLLSLRPMTLLLTNEAQAEYDKFCDWTFNMRQHCGTPYDSMYSKLNIWVLRLAGISHFLGKESQRSFITQLDIKYSVDCMHWFAKSWTKAFDSLESPFPRELTLRDRVKLVYKWNPNARQTSIEECTGCRQSDVSRVLRELKAKNKDKEKHNS